MNVSAPINLDGVERWAGRIALLLIITSSLVFLETVFLYSGDRRVITGAYCVVSFFVGWAVKYALRRFKTNRPVAIRLIENSFYVMCAGTIVFLIDEYRASGISVELVVGDALLIGMYTFIGIKIFEIKRVSTEQTSEGNDG